MRQKGFAHLILLLILTGGFLIGIYLSRNVHLKTSQQSEEITTQVSPSPTNILVTPTSIQDNFTMEPEIDTQGNKKFRNKPFQMEFKYPKDYTVTTTYETEKTLQVDVNNKESFVMHITRMKSQFMSDPQIIFDTETNQKIMLGTTEWYTLYLPHGYADGGNPSDDPFYVIQTQQNNIQYRITFGDQRNLNSRQKQIVSSFKFTN